MDNDSHRTGQQNQTGYTAVLCDTCTQSDDLAILDALGKAIRRSPHGVLVRAPCQLGALWCHSRKNSRRTNGAMLLVQPCDTHRRPLGAVIPIGPIKTPKDLLAVTLWLESAPTSAEGLPTRLYQSLTSPGPAARN